MRWGSSLRRGGMQQLPILVRAAQVLTFPGARTRTLRMLRNTGARCHRCAGVVRSSCHFWSKPPFSSASPSSSRRRKPLRCTRRPRCSAAASFSCADALSREYVKYSPEKMTAHSDHGTAAQRNMHQSTNVGKAFPPDLEKFLAAVSKNTRQVHKSA